MSTEIPNAKKPGSGGADQTTDPQPFKANTIAPSTQQTTDDPDGDGNPAD
jgi:hypothetical protein